MARGWESKSVEAQQQAATDLKVAAPAVSDASPAVESVPPADPEDPEVNDGP